MTDADWAEFDSKLHLPARVDRRLQALMDKNNDGKLSDSERAELELLVEASEMLSLVRAKAFRFWGCRPQ